jgi:signal transduction histidine kinase/ActR/RegA family two-component response regulator
MPQRFEKSIALGAGLIAVMLVASATLDFWNTRRLNEGASSVVHAQKVLTLTSDIVWTLTDAESGVRGFILVGDDKYLHPFQDATERLDDLFAALHQETADSPEQNSHVRRLEEAATVRMGRLGQAIALRRKSLPEALQFVATGEGRRQTDRLRELVANVEGVEHAVLAARERRSHQIYFWSQTGAILSPVIGLALVAVLYVLLRRRFEDARKMQEAETLREADRRKNEFLATLAHELRNPLAPIRNAVELLDDSPPESRTAGMAQAMIRRQLGHMVRLVDDLLDVSRIAKGKLQLRRERIELAAVIESAVEESRPIIDAARHRLTVVLPAERIILDADPTRLSQVFSNLLTNAAKYTDRGGDIRLSAERVAESRTVESGSVDGGLVERGGGEVVVSIRDSGIGIDAEHLTRIFEMFSQAEPALARSQGGLGIGLSLVKQLVELHGGSIVAQSDGPGRGSEFRVRLPVLDVATQPPPAEPGTSKPTRGPKRRLLVVDDNVDAATSLAILLGRMGHDVSTAYDGLEAVQAAAAYRSDVVLLDIGLPKMNGYDAAREIRRQPGGNNVTLIALTGWGQEEDKRRAAEAGFDHHITKPIDVRALGRLLESVAAAY